MYVKIIHSTSTNILRKMLLTLCVCSISFSLFAQNGKRISGTVVDSKGETIIGASISEKGTSRGTVSDLNGNFTLEVSNNATLTISYIGFNVIEMPVGNKTQFNITLIEKENVLGDVVVVGYGTQKKETLTGAIVAISGEELSKTKTGNIQNALIGRMTGVQVNQRSSEPGTFNSDFNIRGMGNTPLIVIDGVPRENMTRLDESEIESVSVLKDASAAVYGSRASYGVVLITTKKGAGRKKFSFEYNNYIGVQNMLLNAELMDAIQYMRMSNEKAANNGFATSSTQLPYQPAHFTQYENGTKVSTDWLGATVKENPLVQQHSFSASGSSDKIDYFVNLGYYDQEGWFKSDMLWYKRYNLRSNVTARLTDRLKAEIFLNLSRDQRHQTPENTWRVLSRGVFYAAPIYPEYIDNDPNKPFADNPILLTSPESGYNFNKERITQTNLSLEYQIPGIDGLTAKGMYSYDYTEDEWKIFRHGYNTYSLNGTVNYNSYSPMNRFWWGGQNTLLQLSLNYNKTFKDLHNLNASLIYEESDREADNFGIERKVVLAAVDQIFAASRNGENTYQFSKGKLNPREDDDNASKDPLYHYANKGFIGRFTYDYGSKYLLEFSFRYDGSSRFAPGHQWGFFPVVSAGWRLSEENFIKNGSLRFINNLKLRTSWGQMGDEGTSSYQFMMGYNYADNYYLFGNDGGSQIFTATSRGIPNPLITWSTSTVADIGVDADFWNGMLGIVADVYRRDRKGLMANRAGSLPGVVGASMPEENLNSDRTEGFEVSLSHRNKIGNVGYNLVGGIFMNRTKNKHYEESAANDSYDKWLNKKTGRWQNILLGYNQSGQYTSFDEIFNGPVVSGTDNNAWMFPGDLKYEDWNGDGIIDTNDMHPIAINTNYGDGVRPLLNYHFSIGAEWKGFDLNILFQGAGMAWRTFRRADSDRDDSYSGFGARTVNGFSAYYDRWHRADENNPDKWQEWVPGKYPSVYYGIGERVFNLWDSNFWAWNTAYLRIKSIELGYTLPTAMVQKAKLESVRIFFNSYNTFTFSSMPLGDPEVKDGSRYPLNRTYSLGLNVKF